MYEKTGRYYAFFGPRAEVTPEEEQFFAHWTSGRRRALDIGAGLCGPATMLARLGLDVLALEPSPVLAALAMDRLNRGDDVARSVTLVECPVESFSEPFTADVILMRSVLMLLNDAERAVALAAARRHAASGARLIVDLRTAALPWVEEGSGIEERRLGCTLFRRRTDYIREANGTTRVECQVEAERFGRTHSLASEAFSVRADTVDGMRRLLLPFDFEVRQVYAAYDINRPYLEKSAMIVAIAEMR